MRIAVRIAGLAAAAALVLWCAVVAIDSFTSSHAGAGLPRLDGGAGLQLLIGLAALVGAGLVVAAAFALARPACRRGQPFWLVVCLLGWAALAAAVASRAAELLLAPVELRDGRRPRRDVHGGAGLGGLLLDRRRDLRRARRRPARPLGARRPRGRARQPSGGLTARRSRVPAEELSLRQGQPPEPNRLAGAPLDRRALAGRSAMGVTRGSLGMRIAAGYTFLPPAPSMGDSG